MKSLKFALVGLLAGLFLIAASTTALAAVEAWTTDPATGSKICIYFGDDTVKLISANWSGPAAGGLAEGQGNLQYIFKEKSGKETKALGDVEMKAGKLDGRVSIKWSDGDSFDGNYREGLREGRGILKFDNGNVYDGEFKTGKFEGRGIFKFANGDVYDGECKADKIEGKGIYKFANGNVYEGEYKAGQREGKGSQKFANGGAYDGEWKADKIDGKGVYKAANGDVYDGEWKAGQYDGKGVYKAAIGDVYDGEWKAGQREGKGIYKFADGRVYEGEFKNDKPDGYGIGKEANSKVAHDGQWKNGEPVKDGQAVGSSSGGALKADKVLGIPWGATDEQAKSIMNQRPKTQSFSFLNGKDAFDRWQGYSGPFANFDAVINIHFYKDKMWMVSISVWAKENQVVEKFNTIKQGLAERYGAPMVEKGKYLDSIGLWDLGGEGRGYTVSESIVPNNTIFSVDSHPFMVRIQYRNESVADLYNNTAKPGSSGSKDY